MISTSDFADNTLTGIATVMNGMSIITKTLVNDVTTEGVESFYVTIRTGGYNGSIVATSSTVTVNDTSTAPIVSVSPTTTSLNEGSAVTFNVSSNQLSSTLYWTLNPVSGSITTSDFVGLSTTGSFTTNVSGVGSTTLTLANDLSTGEGIESFQLQVRTGSPSGTISTTSSTITVADTSAEIPIDPPASTTTTNSFSYVGFPQTFTVPSNVYWLKVTANGAGGGKGNGTQNGGSGGQVVGWVPVQAGEVYKVIVGGGGKGKGSSAIDRYGGGGGGFSGLLFNSNTHVISAGGGGGSQTNTPVTSGGTTLSISGGHTLVGNTSSTAGGLGGISNSAASSNSILNGSSGTGSGGNGGTTWTGSATLDAGGGGGGGGYYTDAGIGGGGSNGGAEDATSGKGGDGGFAGGGGGGGGGYGGETGRTNPAGGGGGGFIGGQGGLNTPTYIHRSGEGGYNFLYWYLLSHPRGGSTALLISTTSGGGSAGATVSGNDGTNGSVTIQYATQ
jgi:hypothetical protein